MGTLAASFLIICETAPACGGAGGRGEGLKGIYKIMRGLVGVTIFILIVNSGS